MESKRKCLYRYKMYEEKKTKSEQMRYKKRKLNSHLWMCD